LFNQKPIHKITRGEFGVHKIRIPLVVEKSNKKSTDQKEPSLKRLSGEHS